MCIIVKKKLFLALNIGKSIGIINENENVYLKKWFLNQYGFCCHSRDLHNILEKSWNSRFFEVSI